MFKNRSSFCFLNHILLSSRQVFIHNPHQKYTIDDRTQSDEKRVTDTNISLLNINEVVTSLSTGQLNANKKSDTLLVGTKTNILAYDVDNNMDLFYKEVCLFFHKQY